MYFEIKIPKFELASVSKWLSLLHAHKTFLESDKISMLNVYSYCLQSL